MLGLIITNQSLGHNAYKIRRLQEECGALGISLSVYTNDGSLASITDNRIVIDLPAADFVIYLDKDIYLARELEKAGYRLFDSADFIKFCDDKMLTNIGVAGLPVPTPKTIAGPLVYAPSLTESNYAFLKKVGETLHYPYVLKRVYGSLGEGVHLISSYEEARAAYTRFFKEPIQFQEYIASSYGRSMRVLIIDEKVVGAFIRTNPSDFRSNYGSSATSQPNVGHETFLALAERLAKYFHIEYAGLDFLFGQNEQPVLCEMNSNAFFEEFEKVTGINVARCYLEMIRRKVEQK